MVNFFKYLGPVIHNLEKAQKVWRRMSRILIREGARPQVSGFFFKVIVQSVLLFGAEMWVVTPHMRRFLGGFQDKVARRLMRRMKHRSLGRRWEYTLSEAAREE